MSAAGLFHAWGAVVLERRYGYANPVGLPFSTYHDALIGFDSGGSVEGRPADCSHKYRVSVCLRLTHHVEAIRSSSR